MVNLLYVILWCIAAFYSVGPMFSTWEENYARLGYYADSSVSFLLTFRDNLSVPLSEFKNPFRSRTQRIGPIDCPET
jgi:hypothetical protein